MKSANWAVMACVCGAGLAANVGFADDLFYAEIASDFSGGGVGRARADGANPTRIVETGAGVRSVAIDSVHHKIYWTDVDNFVIARANSDGSGWEDVISTGLTFPSAIAVDGAGDRMYWLDQDTWLAQTHLDGTNLLVLNQTTTYRGIAIDPEHDKLYWTVSDSSTSGRIMVSRLNGDDVTPVVTGAGKPGQIALDSAGGKLYWSDSVTKTIRRSNIDGSNVETLFTGDDTFAPRGLALDLVHGYVFFGQDVAIEEGPTTGSIVRMSLDGLGRETIVCCLGLVNYIAYVPDCAADFNGDGTLDFFDYLDFVDAFASNLQSADFNHDSVIDFFDYLDFVDAFSGGC